MKTLESILKAACLDTELIGVVSDLVSADATDELPDEDVAVLVVSYVDREISEAIASGAVIKAEDFCISDLKRYMVAKGERDLYRVENGTDIAPVELPPDIVAEARIAKSDATKRVAYCVVYAPLEKQGEDVHGDWMSEAEIEKTAWGFLAKGLTSKVDTEHSFIDIDAQIVESFIVRKNDPDFPDDEGAWVVAVKFNDDETWDKVAKGEFTGLSMAGYGNYVTETK